MQSIFKLRQSEYLEQECLTKSKLRTFRTFKDFNEQPSYVTKPLTFFNRRNLARIRLGCLPLRIETGRYCIPRLSEEDRICLICSLNENSSQLIESESHFLFHCIGYHEERELWYSKMSLPQNFPLASDETKLKLVLNHPKNIKYTADFIAVALDIRNKTLK